MKNKRCHTEAKSECDVHKEQWHRPLSFESTLFIAADLHHCSQPCIYLAMLQEWEPSQCSLFGGSRFRHISAQWLRMNVTSVIAGRWLSVADVPPARVVSRESQESHRARNKNKQTNEWWQLTSCRLEDKMTVV
jgi:hypothetical protein